MLCKVSFMNHSRCALNSSFLFGLRKIVGVTMRSSLKKIFEMVFIHNNYIKALAYCFDNDCIFVNQSHFQTNQMPKPEHS